jgi:hypothetical protein
MIHSTENQEEKIPLEKVYKISKCLKFASVSSLGGMNLGYQIGISTSIFILYDSLHANLEAMAIMVRN